MRIFYTYLTGRCRTGSDGMGTLIHAIPSEDEGWPHYGKALCGAQPGRLSGGWSEYLQEAATCPKCLKKLGQK